MPDRSVRSVVLAPPRVRSVAPIVALHGLLGAPGSLDRMAAALDWPGGVLALALPGHGIPAAPVPETFDAAVDALAPHVPSGAYLVGYSLGGRLALALAAASSGVAGATVVGAHPGLVDAAERAARVTWEDELARSLRAGDLDAFVDRWEALPIFASQRGLAPALFAAQRKVRLGHDPLALARVLEVLGTGRMPDLRPRLAAVSRPLTFVAGALDERYVGLSRELAAAVPCGEAVVIPDAGHNVTLEAPATLARVVASRARTALGAAHPSDDGLAP